MPPGDLDALHPNIQYAAVSDSFTHPLNNYDINTTFPAPFNCHITFDSRGGSGVPDQVKDFGDTVDEPADPKKTGYAFRGWFWENQNTDFVLWDFDTPLDPDIHGTELVLHADWEAQLVAVTGTVSGLPDNSAIEIYYSTDGSTATNTVTTDASGKYSISTLYDSTLLITPSAQTGYGVSPNNRNIAVTTENLADNNFIYTPGKYTVTFETNGGSSVESQILSYGEKVSEPGDPGKKGCIFAAWYTDNGTFENGWDFDSDTITGDLTLYAQWINISESAEPTKPAEPTEPAKPANPETGDDDILLWMSVLCASFAAIRLVFCRNKIKERAKI